jgi:predicted enzyme related to lactoylglutathione lyase
MASESYAMMFGKLGLVMVVVRDMERSFAFYRDVLGLKPLIHQANWSQLDAGNIIIGLHPDGDEVKVSPTTGMSIGIYVDDMDRAVTEIRRRFGKIAIGPRQDPFGRWALVFDPDGYSIQIIEMARNLRAQHKLAPQPEEG